MEKKCIVCGRDSCCVAKGMTLCGKHRSQWYRYHEFNDDTIFAPNEYIFHDDCAEIVLKDRNRNVVGNAIIDLDDVEKCKQYKWHISSTGYVIATIPDGTRNCRGKKHLHRLITDYDGNDFVIDHINRNPLDNRKCNLRVVTQQMNTANRSEPGVIRVPSGRYQSHVTRHYKNIYIGTYDTYDEAIEARKAFVSDYDANDPLRIMN